MFTGKTLALDTVKPYIWPKSQFYIVNDDDDNQTVGFA